MRQGLIPLKVPSNSNANVVSLQRKATNNELIDLVPPIVNEVLASTGQPLDPVDRAQIELRFGHDFSQVRIHTDPLAIESAEAVSAKAYTVGRDVVFGRGQYTPETNDGKRLLAHELAHVVQQSRGGHLPSHDRNSVLEQSADSAAASMTQKNGPVRVSGASSPGLARKPIDVDDSPLLLTSDIDVSKLTPQQRREFIVSIDNRLRNLDLLVQKPPQAGSEFKFQGAQPLTYEAEHARLIDWRKKLVEGSGIIVAHGIPRTSETSPLAVQASVQPSGGITSESGKGRPKPQAHATPPGFGQKPEERSLRDRFGDGAFSVEDARRFAAAPTQDTQGDVPSNSHTTPPGLGLKPAPPRTMDDVIAASIVRPGGALPQSKLAGLMPPLSGEAAKSFFTPRRPGEVTLPGGQTVQIPPKPLGEITEDITSGEVTLAKANVQGVRATLVHNLKLDFDNLDYGATHGRWAAETFLDMWFRVVADKAGRTAPPSLTIWTGVDSVVKQGADAIARGDLEAAVRFLILGQQEIKKARSEWYRYKEQNLGGAENIATGLEVTAEVSFQTLAFLATYASGGVAGPAAEAALARASLARSIAVGAPLIAEAAVTTAQVASGDKVKWGEKTASIIVSVFMQQYGGAGAKGIVNRLMSSGNPAIKKLGQEFIRDQVENFIFHESSVALDTVAQSVVKSGQGQDITWNQLSEQLFDRLTAPEGLLVASLTTAATSGVRAHLRGTSTTGAEHVGETTPNTKPTSSSNVVPSSVQANSSKGNAKTGLPKGLDDIAPGTLPVSHLGDRRAVATKPPSKPAMQQVPKVVEHQEPVAVGQTHWTGTERGRSALSVVSNEPVVDANNKNLGSTKSPSPNGRTATSKTGAAPIDATKSLEQTTAVDLKTASPKAGKPRTTPDLIDAKRTENVKLRESLDWRVNEALSMRSKISKEIGEISERIKELNKAKPLSPSQSKLKSDLIKENIENNNQLAMNKFELERLDRQITASQLTPYEKLTTSSMGKFAKVRATASGIDVPSGQPPKSGRLAGDHLYSLRQLAAHPDFVKLTPVQQNALAHHPRNVVSMDFNANSSKGRLSWAEWPGWKEHYSSAERNMMLGKEEIVREKMHAEIARLLAEGPLGVAQ